MATSNTSSGLFVTWCPDGSSYAVMNSDNTLSVIDVRKAGKIVRSHKFPVEVRVGFCGCGVFGEHLDALIVRVDVWRVYLLCI